MKINALSLAGRHATVYLDEVKLDRCLEVDIAEGYAWVAKLIPEDKAFPGDFIHCGGVIERRTGRIEIKFDLSKGFTEEQLLEDARKNYQPLRIFQLVQ